jgi:UDP-N-acetylmuramoyl-L-alanyl-D-glutamate--2,6-diaminopimelate ligase
VSRLAERISAAMTLDELFSGLARAPRLPVADLTTDSRRVRQGSLFLACRGLKGHGLDYLADAAARGATAAACDARDPASPPAGTTLPLVAVPFLCDRLGDIANRFFRTPSADVDVIGVTGTNGKTTVAWLAAQCLSRLGEKTGYAGTLGYGFGELVRDDDLTSPDVIEIHRRLAVFRDQGAACAAIEVSSHALDQRRVAGVRFESAIFTNLTRDHLDYHGDMSSYGRAKARLFDEYDPRHRVVNVDTAFGASLAERLGLDCTVVSTAAGFVVPDQPYVHMQPVGTDEFGTRVAVHTDRGRTEIDLPLIGGFNVANAACVLGLLLTRGQPLDASCQALVAVTAPPGRMQKVPVAADVAVYVDYAHTPDALGAALAALRPHARSAIWCVFGCGGDRDAGKRPEMGRIAAEHADRVIVTSDNPRSEPPEKIIADIVAGIADRGHVDAIEDRAAAIAAAIDRAAAGDTVLIAGKGHEEYQLIGGQRRAFSDFAVAARALGSREAHE